MELNSPERFGDKGEQSSANGAEHLILEGINGIQSYSYLPGPTSPKDGFLSPKSVPISLRIVDERWRNPSEAKSPRFLRNPVNPDSPAGSLHHVGHKFHEVFQLKQGRFSDLPPAKISEMLKSASLDNAPTQSLLSVVNGILDESMDKKNGEIPYRVACLLRKVVQEIERRLSTQAEHIRNQSNLVKARDEKYQSRIRLLETLANGTGEEALIYMNQLQQTKYEKNKIEEMIKFEEENVVRLTKERANSDEIIIELKKELEASKQLYEDRCLHLELDAREVKTKLEERLSAAEKLLLDSTKKIGELETCSALVAERWSKKEHSYQELIDSQFHTLKELRLVFNSTKEEVLITQRIWQDEFNEFEINLKELADAAQNYHLVLAENRKLYNEVQDLKGNIRVYCRIRPFLQGQGEKNTTIEYIGEDGELLVANPSKKGKEGHRLFKFDKVFGPSASQVEVFSDTRPLIRSVLDGFNVCIFAYGQTGSGKTYTMAGPEGASEDAWGVNYRALNDLFNISRSRRSSFMYELGVQMIEIYNEQVRDLLLDNGGQKRLGIWSTSQPNGLAVPEASMHPVKSTEDVLELMEMGQMNRAVGATTLNLRSSRSHSVLTVHVRGTDLETGAVLRGSLNLVDLAGSERVNRSEATGDRLKEAQHINKSLSALGDVIFALSQKSSHVPYRNSKLTQVLQSSLGGQAKTLMFVQLNPDIESYSESMSTLKFAERVSGVELGAARSNKEGKDVRDLLEQVATLKDIIAKKDDEIEQLQHLKDLRTLSPNMHQSSFVKGSIRHASSSPSISAVGKSNSTQILSRGRDVDSGSDYNDKHSEASSQQSTDDMKYDSIVRQKDSSSSSPNLGNGDGESEGRLSDISDGSLYMGAETNSIGSAVDVASEGGRSELATDKRKKLPSYALAQDRTRQTLSSRLASTDQLRMPVKVPMKATTSVKKSANNIFSRPSCKPVVKQWH